MNAMVSESTAQAKVTAKAAPYLSFIHVSYMFHTLSISWLEVSKFVPSREDGKMYRAGPANAIHVTGSDSCLKSVDAASKV